jgi:cytochrome P450
MAKRLPPGPHGSLLLGNMAAFERRGPELLLEAYQRYGPVFTLNLAGTPMVFMIGPEANQYMLAQHADNFEVRSASILTNLLGQGLLVIDGAQHRRHRTIMNPAFHKRRVTAYAAAMIELADQAMARWPAGRPLRLFEETRYITLDIVARTIFGVELGEQQARLKPEIQAMLSFFDAPVAVQMLPISPPLGPWRRLSAARAGFDRIIQATISERRAAPSAGVDMLSDLMESRDEAGRPLSDQEIADELTTILLAGHDTTVSLFSWMVMLLGQHPAVLDRVRAEQEALLDGRLPTPEDLRAMPYLDQVISETLRLYPPAWMGPRRCIEGFSFAGHSIPARTRVSYSEWATHRLPHYFAEPDSFRPERFDKEHGEKHAAYSYIPFSAGGRVCIGMSFALIEAKALMSVLLHHWHIGLVPGHAVERRLFPVLQPRNDLLVALAPLRRPAAYPPRAVSAEC